MQASQVLFVGKQTKFQILCFWHASPQMWELKFRYLKHVLRCKTRAPSRGLWYHSFSRHHLEPQIAKTLSVLSLWCCSFREYYAYCRCGFLALDWKKKKNLIKNVKGFQVSVHTQRKQKRQQQTCHLNNTEGPLSHGHNRCFINNMFLCIFLISQNRGKKRMVFEIKTSPRLDNWTPSPKHEKSN